MTSGRREWWIEVSGDLTFARCGALDVPGTAHGFSTRRARGRSDFDLGAADSAERVVIDRRPELLRAVGLDGQEPMLMRQVHGATILRASEAPETAPEADGSIALREDWPAPVPAVRVADCVPILLAEASGRALGAVHAGWRGTAAGIVGAAVRSLERLGVPPGDLRVALGPSIGRCCYRVGPEVVAAVADSTGAAEGEVSGEHPSGGRTVDLQRANRLQLERLGVDGTAIHTAPWCTYCERELFFSYRREGRGCGRMMACIGWTRWNSTG